MLSNSVKDQIRRLILEHFPLARMHNIGDADQLLMNGIIDSLGVLDLVTYLEAEFGISVSDEELTPENFQSIDHLTTFVQEKSGINMGHLS